MKARNLLLALLAFLGLGAIGGGGAFILSPGGELMGMPLSNLNNSPFGDFMFPGIILFLVLGVVPCLLVWALIKKPDIRYAGCLNFFSDMHWAWSYTIYSAFALIIWIQVEMSTLGAVHWLHSFYMFYAIAIIFVALLPRIRDLYKNRG
jgi:hypothetical protein